MISVIMLTYNREGLVSRAIESVLAQTYRDFEFIIVDNGSTDRSGQIADEYAARDSRVRVLHRAAGIPLLPENIPDMHQVSPPHNTPLKAR